MTRPAQPGPGDQQRVNVGHCTLLRGQAQCGGDTGRLPVVAHEARLFVPQTGRRPHAETDPHVIGHGTHQSRPPRIAQQHRVGAVAARGQRVHVKPCRRDHRREGDQTEREQHQGGARQRCAQRPPTHLRHAEQEGASRHGGTPRLGTMARHHRRHTAPQLCVQPPQPDGGDDNAEGQDQEPDEDDQRVERQVESGMCIAQHRKSGEEGGCRPRHLSVDPPGLKHEALDEHAEGQQCQQHEEDSRDRVCAEVCNGLVGPRRQAPRFALRARIHPLPPLAAALVQLAQGLARDTMALQIDEPVFVQPREIGGHTPCQTGQYR